MLAALRDVRHLLVHVSHLLVLRHLRQAEPLVITQPHFCQAQNLHRHISLSAQTA